MEKLQWIIELFDRVSGPARKVTAALDAMRAAKDRIAKNPADRAMDSLERATASRRSARQRSLTRGIEEFARSQQRSIDWSSAWNATLSNGAAILGAVGAVAFTAAGAFASVGAAAARSAISIAGFQEGTMIAMQTLLGSRAAASAEFGRSLTIARATPFDTRDVVSMRRNFVGAGFSSSRERDVLTGIAADLAALQPEDSTVLQRLGLAISQIRSAGVLRGQELNQLGNAGMQRGPLFAAIGQVMNLRGSERSVNSQVAALMKAGRITDRIAFAAMARAVMRMTNTSRVGQFSANQSTTIPGLLSTLGSAIPELLLSDAPGSKRSKSSKLFESAGMTAFKTALQTVLGLLSSTSATGLRLQGIFRKLVDDVFGVLGHINEIQGTKAQKGPEIIFEVMLDRIEMVIGAIGTLMKWTAELGGGFFAVIGPTLDAIAVSAAWVIDKLGGDGAQTALWVMKAIGVAIGVIVVALYALVALVAIPFVLAGATIYGFIRGFGELVDKIRQLSSAMPDWMKNLFGSGGAPAPALSGATPMVDRSRDPNVVRNVVSQPNVAVTVNALSAQGTTAEGIANAAASVFPGTLATAARMATR